MNSESVLNIFREITRIPRESGHEEKMTEFLCEFAKSHGLEYKKDQIGNVVITKEASKGKENVPTIVLQGHQDMVCEKVSGCQHDFATDPIAYEIEDGWMVAKNTTLGADDGIGVAAELALLESDIPMGKLECLFTISEETGMDGANALQPGFFTGKTLINLDSEDEGQLFVGCAGGVDTTARFKYVPEDIRPDMRVVKIMISNGMGGHSGDDINKERANTVQLLARYLYSEFPTGYQLIMIKGGNKRNAIARDAEAILAVPANEADALLARFEAYGKTVSAEFAHSDAGLCFEGKNFSCTEKAVDSEVARKLVMSLYAVHHGVQKMSQDIHDLVETSSNLASVHIPAQGEIVVGTSQRSSVESERDAIAAKIEATFVLAGAGVTHSDPYPGWNPNMSSHLLAVCVESYKKLFGVDPEVKAIHAGLECGLFLTKFPDLDMISFGPTLRGVHAPGERLELASNEKFVKLLLDVVTNYR